MQPVVESTPELRRVRDLPRRSWSEAEAQELADMLTAKLRTAYGRERLRPIQGIMIAEAADAKGLFAGVSVGKGKTLPSFLIPTVLNAERPLLLVAANLLEKTQRDLVKWSYHFRVHPRIKLFTYERLSVVSGADALEEYAPDLIVADEMQCLKNRESARGRRFLRYMEAHQATVFVGLGGVTRRSLRDYWHLMCLALKEDAPLPYVYHQLETWADALDPDVDECVRLAPGALLTLGSGKETFNTPGRQIDTAADDLTQARAAYRERLSTTRGVVISPTNEIEASLLLSERPLELPPAIERALYELRSTWETPNGDELQQATDVWRHGRELASGFWYRWDPPPPLAWLEPRKAWNKFVRGILGRQSPGLDSPLQIARLYANHDLHKAWTAVRDLYDPEKHKRAEWVDDFLLRDAAAWLADRTPGIAWVEHNAVGKRLALLTGLPYYGGGPEASAAILDAKGPIIASIKAHGTGKNLQAYSRNLILSCPPSADVIEQLLGRTHRDGQEAAQVTAEFYLTCHEIREGLAKATREARYIEASTGMPQKLLYADRTFDL